MRKFVTFIKRATVILLGLIVLSFVAISLLALQDPASLSAPGRSAMTVIADVAVIDPRGSGAVMHGQMVVIADNRIDYVGPNGSRHVPGDATVIAGKGKYLIPGLWDAHVHTLRLSPQLHFPLLIANGVTSVRDMGNTCSWSASLECEAGTADWRALIARGDMVGPRLVDSVSLHLESVPERDADLNAAIETLKRRGERFLKIQLDEQTDLPAFTRLMQAAHDRKLPLAGHFPFTADLADATHAFHSIEHDWSLLPQCSDAHATFDGRNRSKSALLATLSRQRCEKVLDLMAKSRTAYTPTHIASTGQDHAFAQGAMQENLAQIDRYVIAPQRWAWTFIRAGGKENPEEQRVVKDYHDAALRLTKMAHDRGVAVMAGSDALDPDVLHGLGIHRELQYLVAAGLTPAQALAAATIVPASHFGQAANLGSIESGKLADMVLLDANPLLDIRNTRRIEQVFADGRTYGPETRSAALSYVEDQAHRISMISRFLRGLWLNG